MSGIYIHIPFCKQACSYCDFHFSTNQKLRIRIIDALCVEMEQRKGDSVQPINSIYFGGGSPSILSNIELDLIFKKMHQCFDLSQVKETTIETNPDDHSLDKLAFWKSLGINRLSIGIQSFIDRDLQMMNRAHNANDALKCIQNARKAGFESLTIDLIYGIPNQSFEEWQDNVQKAISLKPDHISAYCLTVEEKTALHHQVIKGEIKEKSDEKIEAEYLHLHGTLEKAGFSHYEISNYAKAGKIAFHNSSYWSGKQYLGFGPSAHSFDGKQTRRWNVSNNIKYALALEKGETYFEREALSKEEQLNENIMTSLRTAAGFDFSILDDKTKKNFLAQLNKVDSFVLSCIWKNETHIGIKPENWLLADKVIRELII